MKIALLIFSLLACIELNATVVVKNSRVTDVTIYRSYARETRMALTELPQGNSEVIISNITQQIDENSIQVGCKNGVSILSVSTRINYITDENEQRTGKMRTWQDSIKLLDKRSRFIAKQKESYEMELNVLNLNNKLGSNTESLRPDLLRELLNLNRLKQAEIKKLIFDADEDYNELRTTITRLQSQLTESGAENAGKPVREVVLKVFSKTEGNTSFKLSYLVTAAGWTPTYEIRCESTGRPLVLNCRAKIKQQTGYDWKNVNIKLSTANPNQNHNRPIMYPIFVDFMQPDYYKLQLEGKENFKNLMNDKAPQMAGNIQIAMLGQKDDAEYRDGLKTNGETVTIAEGEMMVEYEVTHAQDIESDGQEHIIGIQELSIPANYNYHTVPRLDNGVFLVAHITDWGKYNLLAGDATIFFEDMYVGKSYINPNISSDTLLVSLGRDEKINVKRIRLNELSVTKRFSNKKKETRAYETTIRNNKNIPVEIELLDQYPISKNSDIEVTLEEAEGAKNTKEYGKLLWRIKLLPGESKKIRVIYTLKYPEEKIVAEKN